MKGRRPVPKEINDLRGDPAKGKKRLVEEPQAPKDRPECPEYLDDIAKEQWEFITDCIDTLGLLSSVDTSALELYCKSYSRWRKHCDLPSVYKDEKGNIKTSPAHRIAVQERDACRQLLEQFGLTPVARARIGIARGERKKQSETKILNKYVSR